MVCVCMFGVVLITVALCVFRHVLSVFDVWLCVVLFHVCVLHVFHFCSLSNCVLFVCVICVLLWCCIQHVMCLCFSAFVISSTLWLHVVICGDVDCIRVLFTCMLYANFVVYYDSTLVPCVVFMCLLNWVTLCSCKLWAFFVLWYVLVRVPCMHV